jgi:hypothetical protein
MASHKKWMKTQMDSGNTCTGANASAADNGLPVRLTQTTLENYFQNPLQMQTQVQWEDQEMESGTEFHQKQNREPTPLKYIDA